MGFKLYSGALGGLNRTMNITIDDLSVQWYIKELDLKQGDSIRFFARYGGCGTIQKGFSLGVLKDAPTNIGAKTEKDGIKFYIEEDDLWYFDQRDFSITFNEKNQEPEFHTV